MISKGDGMGDLSQAIRDAEIADLARHGIGYKWLAAEYGLTKERARQIARKHGVEARCQRLSARERAIAHRLCETKTVAEIARRLKRRPDTIRGHLACFWLKAKPDHDQDKWSKREEERLRDLYPTKSCQVIADKLGRTRNEVAGKAGRMGLRKKVKRCQ